MPTRIYHRYDSLANWNTAKAAGGGKLLKGELGIVWSVVGSNTQYVGYVGTTDASGGVAFDACPILFRALIPNIGTPGVDADSFEPLIVKSQASIAAGSTVAWNATDNVWEPTGSVLTLESYPTTDGTVVWDQSEEKFVVGAAVSSVELDGGSY